MADTVKKSRIVSDDDENLEEALLEEFNMRLKSMSEDNLQQLNNEKIAVYENVTIVPNSVSKDTVSNEIFLDSERQHHYDVPKSPVKVTHVKALNGHSKEEDESENIYEMLAEAKSPKKTDSSDQYVEMSTPRRKPNLELDDSLVSPEITIEKISHQDCQITSSDSDAIDSSYEIVERSETEQQSPLVEDTARSVKDRMFLSTNDAAATLLFTQTVTSPMLTPSEENIDFLKGFQRDIANSDSTSTLPHDTNDNSPESITASDPETSPTSKDPVTNQNIYENVQSLKSKNQNAYENIEDLKSFKGNIYENVEEFKKQEESLEEHEEHIYQDIEDCKKVVYEEVSNIKKITSQMISDEIMVENSLYNNVDELKLRQVERMATDLDFELDSEKIYESIKTDEEIRISSEHHYETVLNKSETVTSYTEENVKHIEETVKELEESVENLTKSPSNDNADLQSPADTIENFQENLLEHEIMEDVDSSVLQTSRDSTQDRKSPDMEFADEKAQGDNEHIRENATANKEDKNIELYSEFIHHSKTESNYYEKYTKVASNTRVEISNKEKDTESVPPEIVKTLKNQFSKNTVEVSAPIRKEVEDTSELKAINIMKQINKFESKEAMHSDDSTVTECYTETTTIQSDLSGEKAVKKKKTKKTKKEEKENISVKSSFSKFDALQKKNALHIKSSDSEKALDKFNDYQKDVNSCKACSKQVFQMELIKAEKAAWHKNCFRCTECNKQLTVETYASHEGNLYCKPHFKSLFAPKAIEDDTPSSDKPDLGLEELQKLNVKERFQVFEHYQTETQESDRGPVNPVPKKSPSILSKLAKFQSKGMDIGVSDEALNGIPIEESSGEEEEEDDEVPEGEDPTLYKARKVQKEKPFHFTNLNEVKNKWEQGEQNSKDERREERKQEIQSIRSKLFMGKQGKMKEAYQQAVIQSESCANLHKADEKIESCDTKSLKERFEKGQLFSEKEQKVEDEDSEVFQSEISKKSRSLFLELDANASKAPQISPVTPPVKLEVKKARETETPEREIYHDPEVVRSEDYVDDSVIAKSSHTASKMLNKFRQMEESLSKEPEPMGPKPLKRFTPPPEPARKESSSEEESESEEEEEEDETDNQKLPEDLIEAQKAARAKQLRAKFEKWEAEEIRREQNQCVNVVEESGEESQIESTKTIRARFESMRDSSSEKSKSPRVKVNRFV